MPRYFFHVFDECWYLDREGDELPNLQTALAEADRVARELLEDEEKAGIARLNVADEQGAMVQVVRTRSSADERRQTVIDPPNCQQLSQK